MPLCSFHSHCYPERAKELFAGGRGSCEGGANTKQNLHRLKRHKSVPFSENSLAKLYFASFAFKITLFLEFSHNARGALSFYNTPRFLFGYA